MRECLSLAGAGLRVAGFDLWLAPWRAALSVLDDWFGVQDAGRACHAFVGVGKKAPEELRREALRVLDCLRLKRGG